MQQDKEQNQIDPSLSFHLMKFAFQDFQKSTSNLTKHEYTLAYQHANEEMLLHQVILTSEDACCVVIPEVTLNQTLEDVISEYPSSDVFFSTLEENNMQMEEYTIALHNDLRVETVLSRVASTVQSVTAAEILSYYTRNHADFRLQERRIAGHIHIPFNPVSVREIDQAFALITNIRDRVCQHPKTFSREARLHSSCAVSGSGNLKNLVAGELCTDLDKILFSLRQGEISDIIETADGFNILYCKKIIPVKESSLKKASSEIFSILLKKKQLEACRTWLHDLVRPRGEI